MNAVKRCLALIAATLVVGACGGDPTVDDAGTNLSIRATPGAVWVRNNSSATVNIEAVDKLGGPAAGSWSVGTIVGPMTVALDTTYQNTTAGSLGMKARFVVTPTAEGEGTVQFTGTGGPITVPVRIAPDTGAFAVTLSTATPANGEVVTMTAPAGIVFTPASTVRFFSGPLSRDTANGGYTFPGIAGLSADSSQLFFVAGPGAHGVMRVTAVASRSTPGLVTTARTTATLTAPAVDTTVLPITLSNAAPTVLDTVIATIAAPYRFTKAGEPYSITPTSGGAAPIVAGYSADSTQVFLIIPPGATGKLRTGRVVYAAAPDAGYAGRSAATLAAAPPPPLNATFSSTTPAVNTPITITMPAGFKFRPTSTVRFGSTGVPWIITSRAADSSSVTAIPAPGFTSATVTITAVQLTAAPGFSLTLDATTTITTPAAPDLGDDDASNDPTTPVPVITATLTAGQSAGVFDAGTFAAADWLGFGTLTNSEQDYEIVFTNAGSYTVTVDWAGTGATDLDIAATDQAISAFLGTSLTGAKPETMTFNATAGMHAYLMIGFYDGPTPAWLKVQVTRN